MSKEELITMVLSAHEASTEPSLADGDDESDLIEVDDDDYDSGRYNIVSPSATSSPAPFPQSTVAQPGTLSKNAAASVAAVSSGESRPSPDTGTFVEVNWEGKRTFRVPIELGRTVLDLKRAIYKETAILVADQKLIGLEAFDSHITNDTSFFELHGPPYSVTLFGEPFAAFVRASSPAPSVAAGTSAPVTTVAAAAAAAAPGAGAGAGAGASAAGALGRPQAAAWTASSTAALAAPAAPAVRTPARPAAPLRSAEGSLVELFQAKFESIYGMAHPPFFMGSMRQALETAAMLRKVCLVYLHCDESDHTLAFCSTVLGSDATVSFLTENCLVWVGDVSLDPSHTNPICRELTDGRASNRRYLPLAFPYVALCTLISSQIVIFATLEGPISSDDLQKCVADVLAERDGLLDAEARALQQASLRERERQLLASEAERVRVQEQRREADQRESLRREQEFAYEAALAADREREQFEADLQRVAALQDEEVLRQAVEAQAREQEQAEHVQRLRLALPPEPAPGAGVVRVRVRLPTGELLNRNFRTSETLQTLLDYLLVQGHRARAIMTQAPPVVRFDNAQLTFEAAGLTGAVVLGIVTEDN